MILRRIIYLSVCRRLISCLIVAACLIVVAGLIISARARVCRKININVQRISGLISGLVISAVSVTFGATVSVDISVAVSSAAVADFIRIELRRAVIVVLNALISLISLRSRRVRVVLVFKLPVMIAVVSAISAQRNLRAALQRSVRRIAVLGISFRESLRRLSALRIISA